MVFIQENGRNIPAEDKIFGINNRAKAMAKEVGNDKVINATIGALLDDEGNLICLSSVNKVLHELHPRDYCEYAPIAGTAEFKEACSKAVFGKYEPKSLTQVVATPGGTGAIRNTIANYSCLGDMVLTGDWFWSPYTTICNEIYRNLVTFQLFDEERKFNLRGLKERILDILESQDSLVIILNTPAHNPTGYCIKDNEWYGIKEIMKDIPDDKKIILLVDTAYVDFAGDEEEFRSFLPILDEMPENVLPVICYSLSKAYTFYGLRCGAMIAMSKDEKVIDEFKRACEYSSRGSWSNSPRAPQTVLAKIYADDKLKKAVDEERRTYRQMLLERGGIFDKNAAKCGLITVPFDSGFFISIPTDNPEDACKELEKEGVFLVPMKKGIRVSIASISKKNCEILPEKILEAIKKTSQ